MYLSQNQTNVFSLNCILKAAHKAGNYFEKVSSQVENVFVLILKSICHEFKNEYVLILKIYLSKEEEKNLLNCIFAATDKAGNYFERFSSQASNYFSTAELFRLSVIAST